MESAAADGPARGAEPAAAIGSRDSRKNIRGQWANKTEFRLTMVAAVLGLGSIWRFPYLFHNGGGGAFLLPYLVCVIFCGMPMFFLETAVGQYTGEGPYTAWRKICPIFQGIGIASQVMVLYQSVAGFHILVLALFYLFNSLKNPLPWTTCDHSWNTENCGKGSNVRADVVPLYNFNNTFANFNASGPEWDPFGIKLPEEEYLWNYVFGGRELSFPSASIELGGIRWELLRCLLLAWVLCYFFIWKGVKFIGKVVYFTVAFPLVLLFILFIRGVTLPGAWEGIMYYVYPSFHHFSSGFTWLHALIEVLYSFGVSQGVLTTLGSYNRYKHDCYKDCLLIYGLNCVFNVFFGVVLFSFVGFVMHISDSSLIDIRFSGLDLPYAVMTHALSALPAAHLWCIIFFLMAFFFTFDYQALIVESLVTSIMDTFPDKLWKPLRHELLVLLVVVACFLLGLPLVTWGGIQVFILIDSYGLSTMSISFIVCMESIAVGWIYGANRFYDNIEDMIGYQPFPVLKYCWLFVVPLSCTALFIFSLVYPRFGGWSSSAGTYMILAPILSIPFFTLVSVSEHNDLVTAAAKDLKQIRPSRPRLSLCKRVILAAVKPDDERVDLEKVAVDTTDGV
ncbi:hypothetical protein GJAV_G00157650 [Gymnothorax javanicus]|nr:hypothetical protein GJAV_G00157650 [Gymnothorax javanicus]